MKRVTTYLVAVFAVMAITTVMSAIFMTKPASAEAPESIWNAANILIANGEDQDGSESNRIIVSPLYNSEGVRIGDFTLDENALTVKIETSGGSVSASLGELGITRFVAAGASDATGQNYVLDAFEADTATPGWKATGVYKNVKKMKTRCFYSTTAPAPLDNPLSATYTKCNHNVLMLLRD